MPYDVAIIRHDPFALFDLKGHPTALQEWTKDALPPFPDQPNTRTSRNGLDLWYIGRNHWILRAPLDHEAGLNRSLSPSACPTEISIVCISDTLTFFTITGPEATDIMAIACPLDLRAKTFGEDVVTYSELFGLKALVQRCHGGFEVAIEQSFGDMVADYLNRANR